MKKIIEWDSIEVRGNRSGSKKTTCPACSPDRRNSKDPCLSVNFEKGLANCHHCGAVSFRKDESFKPTYTPPPQDWQNYTNLSDGMVKYCAGRGIPQRVLIDFRITEEKQWLPQTNKKENCIVFNYFEGDEIVNKKFRDGRKNFSQSKDGKRMLYNINSIIGAKEVYIVEGEFDVLAMASQGIDNVVSLVNGANDHDDQWVNSQKYLDDVEHFIIAVDNDPKGIEVREKIAHRLGKWRCSYIEWTDKDANGSVMSNNFDSDLTKIVRFPVSGTHTVKDLEAGIFDLHRNGLPKTIKPKHKSFDNVNDIFSVMKGHLVTVTGIPSHGKSNYVEWYVLNLANDHDMKASFFSPEHTPMALHQTNFMQKAIGRNFWKDVDGLPRIKESDISRYTEWANEKLYITAPDRGEVATWEWLIDKFKEQLYSYGINIFVIDAFNKVQMPQGNRLESINDILTKLTAFAQSNDVIIFLVAHPTKMKKKDNTDVYEMPTLYDVSGSADFRNQTHDGFTIHRHFGDEPCTEFASMKVKFQFQGKIGETCKMDYDLPTGRYYEKGTNPPRFDMTIPMEEQILAPAMKPSPSFNTNETFYDIDEEETSTPF